jgi:hypothetical protein
LYRPGVVIAVTVMIFVFINGDRNAFVCLAIAIVVEEIARFGGSWIDVRFPVVAIIPAV